MTFYDLGKILEGGLAIAIGHICEGQLHLTLLAKQDDVPLGDLVKVNFARQVPLVLHSKYCQFESFLCKIRNGIAICRPAAPSMGLSHDGAEVVDPLIVKQVDLIQGGVALVCCELSCDLFCQATDCIEECFDQGRHYGSWICCSASSAYHGQLTWSTNWSGFRSVCRVIFHELRCPFGSV